MESQRKQPKHDEREAYVAPAGKVLGKVAEVTAGVVGFPSCRY